jgi:hypothetical protein
MKKQLMKIQFLLVRTDELIQKLIYLHKLFFINSKINQSKRALILGGRLRRTDRRTKWDLGSIYLIMLLEIEREG